MEAKRILVIGGTGYIGREIVSRLLKRRYDVTVLSRNPRDSGINSIRGNVLDKELLMDKVKGFDIIIYLAATIRAFNKDRYNENVAGVRNIIAAMRRNIIRKIIYFSTQNVYMKKTGPYGNSKKQADKLVLGSGLDYVIIRPNYVYGVDRQNDFYRLAKFIKNLRICPIIGNGSVRIRPVNKEDVAEITVRFVNRFEAKSVIDISGKEIVTIDDVADYIGKYSKIGFIKIHLPIWLLRPFEAIIPLDIESFDADRVFSSKNSYYASDIKRDLSNLVRLL